MNAAERWTCPRCPFVYTSPVPLSAPPLHPCPTTSGRRPRPATQLEDTPQ